MENSGEKRLGVGSREWDAGSRKQEIRDKEVLKKKNNLKKTGLRSSGFNP